MFTNFCSKLALATAVTMLLTACGDNTQAQTTAKDTAKNDTVMQSSLLHKRLPASCFVKDSDNLAFCMPGDTLVYEPNAAKKDQASVNEVIGGFCDSSQNITVHGNSVICSFRQNRTYNANPVNQQAIVASNLQTGADYLDYVAKLPGIKHIADGIYVLYLEQAAKDAPTVNKDVAVQIETKLLTPDLRVHSYMLNDLLTLDSLAKGNPFALVFPTLKKGDVVRVYIDYRNYPGVWNVDSSLRGMPYIWEVKVINVEDKAVVAERQKQLQLRQQQLLQQQKAQQEAATPADDKADAKK